MAATYLSLIFICLIPLAHADGLIKLRYQKIHESTMECPTNLSIAWRSKIECAMQCTQTEACLYFQRKTSVNGDRTCIICSECAYSTGVVLSSVNLRLDTSQLLTGKLLFLNTVHISSIQQYRKLKQYFLMEELPVN